MRRNLLTLAIAGVLGLFVTSSDAQACHKLKKCAAPTPTCAVVETYVPAPIVCEQAPVCAPAPVVCAAPVKKCGFGAKLKSFKMPKFGGFCHKKSYAVASCDTCASPVTYSAPIYAAPQGYSSPQVLSSGQ